MTRARIGPVMAALSFLALLVAAYLTWVKLSGTAPVCAVLSGCETVENSRYSEFLGIPVAAFGMAGAAALLAGSSLWWLRDDRRGLMLAYAVGLINLPVIAWLTYLELAVIGAVCIWCVTYAVLVIVTWVLALAALRAAPAEAA
ncbi:MAG: vitamin K epoxide reductase family protein [Candidatus Limnocylindrales bacterium]